MPKSFYQKSVFENCSGERERERKKEAKYVYIHLIFPLCEVCVCCGEMFSIHLCVDGSNVSSSFLFLCFFSFCIFIVRLLFVAALVVVVHTLNDDEESVVGNVEQRYKHQIQTILAMENELSFSFAL